MPYEIKHKSRNECLIKYVKGDDPKTKTGLGWPIFGCAVVAVSMGMDIILAIFLAIFIPFLFSKLNPPPRDFEIKLNRPKNRISIHNSEQLTPKVMSYALDDFVGLGLAETSTPKRSKHGAYAELFLKFEPSLTLNSATTKDTLFNRAKKTQEDGESFWKTPIQPISYPVPLDNAVDILESVEEWLGDAQGEEALEPEEDAQELEPMRDFRDFEADE